MLRISHMSVLLSAIVLSAISPTLASDNGMDMSMDGAMSLASGQMLTYFHFTPGDILWFYGWVPSTAGAMVGACIGLFLLGIVERWISACRAVMEIHWSKRAQMMRLNRINATAGLPVNSAEKARASYGSTLTGAATLRTAPPFIISHDVPRAIIHVVQTAMQFLFMLAVMTFQVGFIFSLVVGLGVGEALFGRYGSHTAHMA